MGGKTIIYIIIITCHPSGFYNLFYNKLFQPLQPGGAAEAAARSLFMCAAVNSGRRTETSHSCHQARASIFQSGARPDAAAGSAPYIELSVVLIHEICL